MNMIKEYKAIKDGIMTPHRMIKDCADKINMDEVEDMIIITVDKNGVVSTGFSTMLEIKALGIMEKASRDISYYFDEEA